ncbi:hypothetical protein M422DRAFT_219375 [Sphaerobolus stellatus SS14]|nr:hypothetical protein M422DRAFT_219375 [Sphaerobolus stellatus SS14]
MFFDLNVPVPTPGLLSTLSGAGQGNKKGKQKQKEPASSGPANSATSLQCLYTTGQVAAIEARIDLLVHMGYAVLALNQIMQTKIDAKTHVNWLEGLVPKLKKRQGILILKRLTVVLDEESDRGNGVNPQHLTALNTYDLLSLRPTTSTSFSAACLTHSVPSPHTAHIISVPVTLPRLPFYLKHTLIRTALKNGAVFEIDYAGAVGPEAERRNWWAGAREVTRVTKGKGVLVSGGAEEDKQVRAPRDIANLITLIGLAQNLSQDAIAQTPRTVVLRAESRKTYRSVLSEPKFIIPSELSQPSPEPQNASTPLSESTTIQPSPSAPPSAPRSGQATPALGNNSQQQNKKRLRDDADSQRSGGSTPVNTDNGAERSQKKKKKK